MVKKAESKEGKAEKPEKAEKANGKEESHKAEKAHKREEKDKKDSREEEKPHMEKEHGKPMKGQKPKRGKHGKEKFVELKPAEIVEAIVHLANEGHSQSEIGMILRDQYGIPKVSKTLGKKLSAVLQEHKLMPQIPEDLMDLIRKSVTLRAHLEKNRKDMSAKRGLMLTVSKIRALERYYKRKGRLPLQWRYTPETAALLAK